MVGRARIHYLLLVEGEFSGREHLGTIARLERPPPPRKDIGDRQVLITSPHPTYARTRFLQVLVRDNNVDQAMRVLKKKLQREGFFRELRRKKFYEKPSERKAREKSEAMRRSRKQARKQLQREGLLPPPKPRKLRPGFGAGVGSGRAHGPAPAAT
jgi:small subunit ribosomal protein S21